MGDLYRQTSRWEESEACYQQVLSHNRKHRRALASLGWNALLQEKYNEAEKYLGRVLRIEPHHYGNLLLLAWTYWMQEEKEQALETTEKILEIAPDDYDALVVKGWALGNSEGVTCLVEALKLKPNMFIAWYELYWQSSNLFLSATIRN